MHCDGMGVSKVATVGRTKFRGLLLHSSALVNYSAAYFTGQRVLF